MISKWCFIWAGALLAAAPAAAAEGPYEEIIKQVSAAIDSHPLVGLGEHHRQQSIHQVFKALIADPRVVCKVDDIAVEFGNSALQPIADRFAAGEPVSEAEKRSMWRDTGQWLVWDSPVYEQFFDAVREVNVRKLCPKPVRILLADPPIVWSKVHTAAEYRPYRIRDQFLTDLLAREVLGKSRKALIIAGDTHLWKALPEGNAERQTMGVLMQQRHPGALVSFAMLPNFKQAGQLKLPPQPGLLVLQGTEIGRDSFAKIAATDEPIKMNVGGKVVERPMREVKWPPAEQVVDGLFNIPEDPEAEPDPSIYRDPAYQAELRRRAVILKEVHGFDFLSQLEEILATP